MKNLIPFFPWPFGPKRPQFYLCNCEQCGFTKTCEISDNKVIFSDKAESSSAFMQVKELPKNCPKCGGKLKNKKIPSPLKY